MYFFTYTITSLASVLDSSKEVRYLPLNLGTLNTGVKTLPGTGCDLRTTHYFQVATPSESIPKATDIKIITRPQNIQRYG